MIPPKTCFKLLLSYFSSVLAYVRYRRKREAVKFEKKQYCCCIQYVAKLHQFHE